MTQVILKYRDDLDGSGAKYSAIHVGRSCFFAWDLLPAFGFDRDELRRIQNAISATAISERMEDIPFRDSREWLIGAIVATGDMLGQMAAEDYPERLAGLYLEFREATHFSRFQKTSFAVHKNLLDLLEGTEKFFNGYVMRMFEQEWHGIYRVLDDRRGGNCYIERIRANISRVNLMARSLAASQRESVARRFFGSNWTEDGPCKSVTSDADLFASRAGRPRLPPNGSFQDWTDQKYPDRPSRPYA